MNLDLDVNEINFILQTLGELPSKSGVWPLIVKVIVAAWYPIVASQ